MSENPLIHGWRYYGCARWGCDAVNPDYQSYGTSDGRSWCLHHRPGPFRRFLMAWTVLPAPATRQGIPEAMLPIEVVKRHYSLTSIDPSVEGGPLALSSHAASEPANASQSSDRQGPADNAAGSPQSSHDLDSHQEGPRR